MIFILKCDGAGCEERVALDERHVNPETLAISASTPVLKGWLETCVIDDPQTANANGGGLVRLARVLPGVFGVDDIVKRPAMHRHYCQQCAAKGK